MQGIPEGRPSWRRAHTTVRWTFTSTTSNPDWGGRFHPLRALHEALRLARLLCLCREATTSLRDLPRDPSSWGDYMTTHLPGIRAVGVLPYDYRCGYLGGVGLRGISMPNRGTQDSHGGADASPTRGGGGGGTGRRGLHGGE